jgi:hypothetical protein
LHLVWHRSDVNWPRYGRFPYYRSVVKNRQIRHRTRFRADIDRFGSLNSPKRQNPLLPPTQIH